MTPDDPTLDEPDPGDAAATGSEPVPFPDRPPQPRSTVWDEIDDLFRPKSQQPRVDAFARGRGRYKLDPPELAGHIVTAVRALLGFVDAMTDHGYEGFQQQVDTHLGVTLPPDLVARARAVADELGMPAQVLIARVLAEELPTYSHPSVGHVGHLGRDREAVVGGRSVWQIIAGLQQTAQTHGLDLDADRVALVNRTAADHDIDPREVSCAVEFWENHPDRIDKQLKFVAAAARMWDDPTYREETAAWEATSGDGLEPEDFGWSDAGQSRDPTRIGPVVAALQDAWQRHPGWRLGQLVTAASPRDLFSTEEDGWLHAFRRLAQEPDDSKEQQP